jgi:type II secretory pathway pseudopilin PulG
MKKIKNNKNNKKNQNGFALVLAILLLVVMSIMGVTLVTIVSGDFNENEKRDEYQQALYAAETGVNDAKVWLRKQGLPTNPIVFNGGGVTGWCPISRFNDLSNLSNTYVVGVATSGGKNFNAIINSVDADKTKYENFEFYWFISYPPTWDTASNSYKTTAQITASALGSAGTNISEGSNYKSSSTSAGLYYKIYACGRKKPSILNPFENTPVAALDVLVKAVK